MSFLERPRLKLKIELEVPDLSGAPPRKFMVSRALKARWSQDSQQVSQDILDEIKNYKGSFIGDTIHSLTSLFKADGGPIKEDNSRSVDVARWASSIIETIIFSSIRDGAHEAFIEEAEIPEWDGTTRSIGPLQNVEIEEADIEKMMTLLAPKIKHALFLISKSVKNAK
ncbi:MAG: hypothetical protein FJZ60_00030 [Chlamydiae bacterium]|nr:hypothetical protein [Chlamydiota bacterium]